MIERVPNPQNMIVTMDRSYKGFNMIEHCNRSEIKYLIRCKVGRGAIKEIQQLPDHECDRQLECQVTTSNHYYTQCKKDPQRPHLANHVRQHYKTQRSKNTRDKRWDFEWLSNVKFRVVKFQLSTGEWEVLITNLNQQECSLVELKQLYHLRWGIETAFSHIKYDLNGIQLQSHSDQSVLIELTAHFTMYNIISQIKRQVVITKTNLKYQYQVKFNIAVQLAHEALNRSVDYQELLGAMAQNVEPIRPNRHDRRK